MSVLGEFALPKKPKGHDVEVYRGWAFTIGISLILILVNGEPDSTGGRILLAASIGALAAGFIALAVLFVLDDWGLLDQELAKMYFCDGDRRGGRNIPAAAVSVPITGRVSKRFVIDLLAETQRGEIALWNFVGIPRYSWQDLAKHPECGVMSRLTMLREPALRLAAAQAPWPALWPKAIETMIQMPHEQVRLAAISVPNISRTTLIHMAVNDELAKVAASALTRLGTIMTPEARKLLRSRHSRVRVEVIKSGVVEHVRLLRSYAFDQDYDIHLAASSTLPAKLSKEDCSLLLRSPFEDVRLKALESYDMPHRGLLRHAINDTSPKIREVCRSRLSLTLWSTFRMALAGYVDTSVPARSRLRALVRGVATHWSRR